MGGFFETKKRTHMCVREHQQCRCVCVALLQVDRRFSCCCIFVVANAYDTVYQTSLKLIALHVISGNAYNVCDGGVVVYHIS